jgi:hypothetical protein
VEHAIDTDGAKYLLTPRNEMNYFAYHSIDVGLVWTSLLLGALLLVYGVLRLKWLVLRSIIGLVIPGKQKQH